MKIIFILIINIIQYYFLTSVAAANISIIDRFFLSKSIASGEKFITLAVATKNDKFDEYINFIKNNDGHLKYSSYEIGYVRVDVPIKKVLLFAEHQAVHAAGISDGLSIFTQYADTKRPENNDLFNGSRIKLKHVLGNVSPDSPILGLKKTGLISLRQKYPSFDARGTTIAIIESYPDMTTPELRLAKSREGKKINKLAGAYAVLGVESSTSKKWFNSNLENPLLNNLIKMSDIIYSDKNIIVYEGKHYLVPEAGGYRIGFVNRSALRVVANRYNSSKKVQNINSDILLPVLHKPDNGCFWIDVDESKNFNHKPCLKLYNDGREFYRLKYSNMYATAPFILIETDSKDTFMVGTNYNGHTDFVARAAAGANLFGKNLHSAAPGAQILSVAVHPHNLNSIIEGVLLAARKDYVDVISLSMGDDGALNLSSNVFSIIIDRITSKYNKLIFIAAGNSPVRVDSISSLLASSKAITVGQFHAQNTLEIMRHHGKDMVADGSSSGPTEDGVIKPDIIAPSLLILPASTREGYEINQENCPGIILFAGSECVQGSSIAAPVAAGLAATLIGAARDRGISVSANKLREAIIFSADFIAGVPANRQGNGLFRVDSALLYLEKNYKEIVFDIEAPVNTGWSNLSGIKSVGLGLYDRQDWVPGAAKVRKIKITRRTGYHHSSQYKIKIIGNEDNTFSVSSVILLPLNKTVEVPIFIRPNSVGIHSAILEIRESESERPLQRIGLTVVAAEKLDESNKYHLTGNERSDENRRHPNIFFYVPPNMIALNVKYSPFNSGTRVELHGPLGRLGALTDRLAETGRPLIADLTSPNFADLDWGSTGQQSVFMPMAGIWIMSISDINADLSNIVDYKFEIQAISDKFIAENRNMSVQKSSVNVSGGKLDELKSKSVNVIRLSGVVERGYRKLPTLIEFEVPIHVERIDVRIMKSETNDQPHYVSGMLMDCVNNECYVRDAQLGVDKLGLIMGKARAGKWMLSIDAEIQSERNINIWYEITMTIGDEFSDRVDFGIGGDFSKILSVGTVCVKKEIVVEKFNPNVSVVEYLLSKNRSGVIGFSRGDSVILPFERIYNKSDGSNIENRC